MGYDLEKANETLRYFERLVEEGRVESWSGELKVGVDLGTANIVIAVVDSENRPVAGASTPSRVVRDGIVVDYIGAVRALTRMKAELEAKLGCSLYRQLPRFHLESWTAMFAAFAMLWKARVLKSPMWWTSPLLRPVCWVLNPAQW